MISIILDIIITTCMLIDVGRLYLQQSSSNRVAVIPIDPSSHISGGSILGKIVMNTSYRLMDGWMKG